MYISFYYIYFPQQIESNRGVEGGSYEIMKKFGSIQFQPLRCVHERVSISQKNGIFNASKLPKVSHDAATAAPLSIANAGQAVNFFVFLFVALYIPSLSLSLLS